MMRTLTDVDKEKFLYLHRGLMAFTSGAFNIYNKFKSVEDLRTLSKDDLQKGVIPIRKVMYKSENIANFINKTTNLTTEEKDLMYSWQYAYSDRFFVVKHLEDNTILLTSEENKLYGILGISNGLDEMIPDQVLPAFIDTTLLPFKQQIIYDGFFTSHNILFGGNITRRLKQTYAEIKGEKGIISKPVAGQFLKDLEPQKPDDEIIKYCIKQDLKKGNFPNKAWHLAQKSEKNRVLFEQEFAKFYARENVQYLKRYDEIKAMYYAMYRSCVIGVSDTKKSLIAFCAQHYPKISNYLYIFKA